MRADRALLVALGMLALTAAAFTLYQRGPSGLGIFPGCIFHRATGLHCPGCGMTRATYAALHGRFFDAFRLNPVGVILLPLALLGVAMELSGWVRGKVPSIRLSLGKHAAWAFFAVLLSFWILRNIPHWPFTLLAPP